MTGNWQEADFRNTEVAHMTVSIDPADVRQIVVQSFLELDATEEALAELEEKLLIEEGRYFARSYLAADLMAMWLIEVGVLQFYDAQGNMLRTVNLFEELMPVRMAA
jgi:hypothetical protein